jgi:hypothetical protein
MLSPVDEVYDRPDDHRTIPGMTVDDRRDDHRTLAGMTVGRSPG